MYYSIAMSHLLCISSQTSIAAVLPVKMEDHAQKALKVLHVHVPGTTQENSVKLVSLHFTITRFSLTLHIFSLQEITNFP